MTDSITTAGEDFQLLESMTLLIEQETQAERISFHRLESAMHGKRKELALEAVENDSAWADAVAFGLQPNEGKSGPFHTYFGPSGIGRRPDGSEAYFPEVRDLDIRALVLWEQRLALASHDTLRARYSDLLWEFARPLGRKSRNPDHARSAIEAYEGMVLQNCCQEFYGPDDAALRMLTLALSTRDESARERAKELLLLQHRMALSSQQRVNLQVVDRLLWERNLGDTTAIVAELIGDLEDVLGACVAPNGSAFDPFLAGYVGDRLKRHYERERSRRDVKRVHILVGQAYEHLSSLGSGIVAAAHLDRAASEFARAGAAEAHSRARIARAEAVSRSNAEMTPHSIEMRVSFDQMEQTLSYLVPPDDPGASLVRIADAFVPRVESLRQRVLSAAEAAPLQAMISITVFEEEHVAAIIGSVQEDMEGRAMREAGQTLVFQSLHLQAALERFVQVHQPSQYDLAGWASRLGAFDDSVVVAEGIEAWLVGDWIKALHVLVPQVEAGLRATLKTLNEPVVKNHPTMAGRQILLNMGEVLSTPAMQTAMGEDIIHYFRALYVDPRAKNLRNVVAHGLSGGLDASSQTCDLLIHSLLTLGCWREVADSRLPSATPSH